jgi:hypothetical protein
MRRLQRRAFSQAAVETGRKVGAAAGHEYISGEQQPYGRYLLHIEVAPFSVLPEKSAGGICFKFPDMIAKSLRYRQGYPKSPWRIESDMY